MDAVMRRASGPIREAGDSERLRPRWLNFAAGVLLVLLAGVLGFVTWQARGEQVEVWQARERLAAGTTLAVDDARLGRVVVQADSVASSIPAGVDLAGRTLRIDVANGGLLTGDQLLASGDVFERAEVSVVGLALDQEQAPMTLAAGDIVSLFLVDDAGAAERTVAGVRVLGVNRDASTVLATVEIVDAETEAVVLAAAQGRVLVAVTGRS